MPALPNSSELNNKVIVLYGKLSDNPQEDELDVLDEVNFVSAFLLELGYKSYKLEFSLNIDKVISEIQSINPLFVFNLVETIENNGEFHYFSPAILQFLKIPYTGVSLNTLFITTDKVLTKELLKFHKIKTPEWYSLKEYKRCLKSKNKFIIKPKSEDGSLGLDEESIFNGVDAATYFDKFNSKDKGTFFIEEFVEGREFNISVLAGEKGPEVLPPAEILFQNFPSGKSKIMGYRAKWKTDSFEYQNTSRTFNFDMLDFPLLEKIKSISLNCWNIFKSGGYIRVDLRVDPNNVPYVIEINGNPCISPSSGFYAAAQQAGYDFKEVMQRIIADTLNTQ